LPHEPLFRRELTFVGVGQATWLVPFRGLTVAGQRRITTGLRWLYTGRGVCARQREDTSHGGRARDSRKRGDSGESNDVHDNGHSLAWAARIVDHEDAMQQVVPVDAPGYVATYRFRCDRDWLTAAEARELRQL
jgi:hypothetical protein